MTTLLENLRYFQSKRKFPNWEPKANSGTIQKKGTPEEEVVLRCLEFVDLEIQVGDWVTKVSKEVDDEVGAILLRNVSDELKHDAAIRYLLQYYGVKQRSNRAEALCENWRQLKDSPVVAAYALEMGIFFTILPILMRCGDVYAATVASWINDDERVHVETNLRLMKHFGLKLSSDVLFMVYHTVEFIYLPLGSERAMLEANRAVRRLVTTKDPQMLKESLPVTISYFEQNSNQDIVYS